MKAIQGWAIALVVCALVGTGGMGCNTFRGAGKDIQKGGEAIEKAADNSQEDMKDRKTHRHTIMASAGKGGSISPSGNTSAAYGSNRTYSVTPRTGYHVADVVVDGKSVGAVNRHTFDNIRAGHTISALFTENPNR